jgi:hypothetical protein
MQNVIIIPATPTTQIADGPAPRGPISKEENRNPLNLPSTSQSTDATGLLKNAERETRRILDEKWREKSAALKGRPRQDLLSAIAQRRTYPFKHGVFECMRPELVELGLEAFLSDAVDAIQDVSNRVRILASSSISEYPFASSSY